MFNIYVADSKEPGATKSTRLTSFNGLSLGEMKSVISDLIERDLKKGYHKCLNSTPKLSTLSQQNYVEANTSEETEGSTQTADYKELAKVAEDVLYDKMSQHEILTTVWAFSDKTLIIVKS